MEKNTNVERLREINIYSVLRKIKHYKKLYFASLSITLIVSSVLIFSIPRYYKCSVKLAPEATNSNTEGLSSLSSAFGFNLGSLTSQDAIVPEFYPDVMKSVGYTTGMFRIKVTTLDKKISTNYYDYLCNHQKVAWWTKLLIFVKHLFANESKAKENGMANIDSFKLTKKQNDIAQLIMNKVKSEVDKKTNVITITVTDQDPLVCATLADSVKNRLQQFIIKYRTSKAQNDLSHALSICNDAKAQYIKSQRAYASYSDSNESLILQSYKSKQEELENEMQLQYNNYQMAFQQVQLARAKVQERTPVFTTLQEATVPLKPAGPKRMVFLCVCLFLSFIATTIYVYRQNL